MDGRGKREGRVMSRKFHAVFPVGILLVCVCVHICARLNSWYFLHVDYGFCSSI